MQSESTAKGFKNTSMLDLPVEQLVEAINDPEKAEELMKERGWEKKDLIARAELLTKELASGISAVNMV